MTIKASYNTQGEKVFSFHTSLYSKGEFVTSVNNSEYERLPSIFPSFDSNEIVIFKGNNGGFFLTVTHENEPVRVLKSFISIDDLHSFINDERFECEKLNRSLYKNDVFFAYYLLQHFINGSNPLSPRFHLLIKEVNNIEHFHALFNCYESLYEKREKYNKESQYFSVSEFYEMLTEDEMSILKFSVFCKTEDYTLCDSWIKSFLSAIPEIKNGAFESFGISDERIDGIFKTRKIHQYYFYWRIRNNETPSVYYFEAGTGVESYLKAEDELKIWRSGKKFCEYLSANRNYIEDMNEPDDHA